jgi:hypothetical protein
LLPTQAKPTAATEDGQEEPPRERAAPPLRVGMSDAGRRALPPPRALPNKGQRAVNERAGELKSAGELIVVDETPLLTKPGF